MEVAGRIAGGGGDGGKAAGSSGGLWARPNFGWTQTRGSRSILTPPWSENFLWRKYA